MTRQPFLPARARGDGSRGSIMTGRAGRRAVESEKSASRESASRCPNAPLVLSIPTPDHIYGFASAIPDRIRRLGPWPCALAGDAILGRDQAGRRTVPGWLATAGRP